MARVFGVKKRPLFAAFLFGICIFGSWLFVAKRGLHHQLADTVQDYVCPMPPSLFPQMMLELHGVIVQLQRYESADELWSQAVENQVVRVLNMFDPKYTAPPRQKSVLQPVGNTAGTVRTAEFCPESFVNNSLAEPYYLNGSWVQQDCPNVLPIETLVSVVVYVSTQCSNGVLQLPITIHQTHPSVQIYVAVDPFACGENWSVVENERVAVVSIGSDWSAGRVWNTLVSNVATPYVLVGRDMDNFSWLSQVRRQVSLMSDPLVHVVGGSARNLTGHWQVGCQQSYLYNYILEYKDGYYKSKNECMYCDNIIGPFLARSSTLKEILFDEGLSLEVVFEDWFLRIKQYSRLVMNCPDSLYFASDPSANKKEVSKDLWLSLVKKWQINRIVLAEGQKMSFSCLESNLKCTDMYAITRKRLMPICCMDQLAGAMRDFHELCLENGLIYNYIGGSVLGAVKFRGIIPWDFDGDGEYYAGNINFFLNWSEQQTSHNRSPSINDVHSKAEGYFKLWSPDMFVEMWPKNDTVSDVVMPEVFSKTPTLMRVHGVWVYGPPSPGLHARNMYGREILQHANSWYHTGKRNWKHPYSIAKHFMPCDRIDHHACQTQFSTDGNLQFAIP